MQIYLNTSKVHYKIEGKGQNILLLHGFCEDSSMWAEWVERLKHQFRVITVDLPGFGASSLQSAMTIRSIAQTIEQVLDKEAIQQCYVFGHSMGGYIGLELSQLIPDKLCGLGLIHSHPFTDTPNKIKNRRKTIEFIKRHGVGPFAGPFVRSLFRPEFCALNKKFIEGLIYHTSTHHSDAIIAASEAMIERKDHSATLSKLNCPVLFIVGAHDQAIAPILSLRQLSLPKTASVHILEDVAHMAMFEAKDKSLNILYDFIQFCT